MRFEPARQDFEDKPVVDVLHHPVDRIRELPRVVKLFQVAEMPPGLQSLQGMLDVPRNRGVDVEPRRLVVTEGSLFAAGVGMPETPVADFEGSSELDVIVDVVRAQKPRMLAKRDERGVEQFRAVAVSV